ncbi:hypothetical protein ACXDF8_01680 [Mycolicibacterium sp. CBM1]
MTRPVQQLQRAPAPEELVDLYRDPPDQNLLLALRGFADGVLVGAGTVRTEGDGPVRLTGDQVAERRQRWGSDTAPPIAVVTLTGLRAGGMRRILFEAEMKQRRRTPGRPGHEAAP